MDGSKKRIAVTGTGGGVGQSIIKALYDSDYDVIALDGEPLGVGLYAVARSHVIPYAKDPAFIDRLLTICQLESCQLLFPGLDAELPLLSAAADRFMAIGTQVIVSSPEVVDLSDNKLLTFTALTQYGFSVPYTIDLATYSPDHTELPRYPFILKPKTGGRRSVGVRLVKNEQQFNKLMTSGLDLANFVAQQYIEGDEYTCGSVNLNGKCKGVIVMRRTLRNGDTFQCFAVRDQAIETEVTNIMNAVKPFGACNVQLRVKDNKIYVLEINARCSGTTAARALCGFNEPKMIADFLLCQQEPSYDIKEQTILRYWKELVIPNEIVDQVQQHGSLTNNTFTQL